MAGREDLIGFGSECLVKPDMRVGSEYYETNVAKNSAGAKKKGAPSGANKKTQAKGQGAKNSYQSASKSAKNEIKNTKNSNKNTKNSSGKKGAQNVKNAPKTRHVPAKNQKSRKH